MPEKMRRNRAVQRVHMAQREQPIRKIVRALLNSQWKDNGPKNCFWTERLSLGWQTALTASYMDSPLEGMHVYLMQTSRETGQNTTVRNSARS